MSAATRARWCPRALSRTAIVGVTATAAILLFAIPALAHITVTPGSAQPGSTAVLTFHVPNEEAKADTTKVDMRIPTDHPIAQLLVKPVPGWTISVKTTTLAKPIVTDDGQFNQAVSEVMWSGGQIAPGQFQDFTISADPLPQGVSSLTFKTIQTYSNGDVVRWIDVPQPGQPQPDHPAPVLTLSVGPAAAAPVAAPAAAAAATGGSDGMARGIAIGGVVIGVLGLTFAGLAFAGLSWRRGKGAVVAEPSAPAPNGHVLAMASAAKPVPESRNGTQSRNGTEPRRAGSPVREAPRRKSASSSRRRTHR
ncbi:MAG TPA: YcnI family protein [Streptosporangiaceae bacterium]